MYRKLIMSVLVMLSIWKDTVENMICTAGKVVLWILENIFGIFMV